MARGSGPELPGSPRAAFIYPAFGRRLLDKHNGRHCAEGPAGDAGFALSAEELDFVDGEVTALADKKNGLMDEEIAGLALTAQQAMATGD